MSVDFPCSDHARLLGSNATHAPAPCSPRHAALLVLAGISLLRSRALPGMPITTLASAFN
jgi:hypothetical protein